MRIALDAGPLIEPTGGIPRYVVELTRALATEFPDDELHLLSDQTDLSIDAALGRLPNLRVAAGRASRLARSRWWSLGLPLELRRLKVDVFHGTNFEIPYLPLTPAVLTVHDLSPWKTGPARAAGERVRRRAPRLFRLARRLITPTEAVRSELAEGFHVPLDKIVAVPHAASDAFEPAAPAEIEGALRDLGVRRPYLLSAGAENPRKNLDVLIAAWRRVRGRGRDLNLVLAGGARGGGVEAGLTRLGPVSDRVLTCLLGGATAFVYPSLYEGFGLPILEAMRAGAPVIASADPALREVAGGAALHAARNAAEEYESAILKVSGDSELAERLRRSGRKRAARFSWAATARATRSIYESVIRG